MYAVVSTGGKQYRVAEGDLCRVEKLDAEEGASVEIVDPHNICMSEALAFFSFTL